MEYCRNLQKLHQADLAMAGGKGASLGELLNAGLAVPPGFVVLTTAFDKFMEHNEIDIKIKTIFDNIDTKNIQDLEKASIKIQSLIQGADIAREIREEINKYFQQLNTKYVAVRSSATAEDNSMAAWAGQLNSYLNTTEKELIKNIKNCWASLFTPRAIFYRFEKGLEKNKISVAVVIQEMINSEIAGIAFSVHPVTQNHNHAIIEAAFGLGEAIVSGAITPDSYTVDKKNLNIVETNIKTNKPILDPEEILDLTKLIKKIEKHFNFPVDIEWAKQKNIFYILQSRPITTLK